MKTKAYAKVNLLLKVIGKRKQDGYHQLQMIMQTISLADELSFKVTSEPGVKVSMKNHAEKIKQEDNIVYKIAVYMLKRFRINKGLQVTIKKQIPEGAGLGGGSSDGAETIKAINKIFALNLNKKQMINIGKKFGADVPFFIDGGTSLVTGIGDKIKTLQPIARFYALVIKPSYSISTKQVYQKVDKYSKPLKLPEGNLSVEKLERVMKNDLTKPATEERPALKKLITSLQKKLNGTVMMTGSGSAIVVYYMDKKTRDRDHQEMLPVNKYQIYPVESIDPGLINKKSMLFKTLTLGTMVTLIGGMFYSSRSIKSGTNP